MKSRGPLRVSMRDGQLNFVPIEGHPAMADVIELSEDLVELAVEEIPTMRRGPLSRVLNSLLAAHIPGPSNQYSMDFLTRRLDRSTTRAILVIVKNNVLDEIRASYPWRRLISRQAEHLLRSDGDSGILRSEASLRIKELFPPRRMRPLDRRLLASLAVLFALLGINLWWNAQVKLQAVRHQDKQSTYVLQQLQQTQEQQALLQNLQEEYRQLVNRRPPSFDTFLAVLSNHQVEITIDSISMNGRQFRIFGSSPAPLELAHYMEENPMFGNTRISNIRPKGSGPRQSFTMEGIYLGF